MNKNLKEVVLKQAYDSDRDDLLKEFYIPAMSVGVSYKRLAGFFSSGILSAAARGIAEFIENDGTMKLIVGLDIHEDDYEAMQNSLEDPQRYVLEAFEKNFKDVEQFLREDKVEALGWMLANKKMEMKVGLVPKGGLFHLKVGIIEDREGNKISFSGSDNETPSAWKHNVEEFKVFRGWVEGEADYFKSDEEKFDRFWSGQGIRAKIIDLPNAIRDKLIRSIPHNKKDLKIFKDKKNIADVGSSKRISGDIGAGKKLSRVNELHPHQEEAIKALNMQGGKGILAMATGSGKTITALAYAERVSKVGPLCTIVALPYIHLVRQWIENDIRPMFPDSPIIEVHGQSQEWKTKLSLFLSGFRSGAFERLFIVGLYGSLASEKFTKIISDSKIPPEQLLFIGDEVHNAGAAEGRKSLLEGYGKRVGLSATPKRHFDEEGTDIVKNYFGGIVYEYSLKQAIQDGYLTPYEYFPQTINLTEEEYSKYKEITVRISRLAASVASADSNLTEHGGLKTLLILRSKILKSASEKITAIDSLLQKLRQTGISNTLIYCDDLKQLGHVQSILNDLGIVNHKFTQEESLPLRETILKNFASGVYKVLVAVKCLDEGVDVPATKTAIILASTTNPREFIQRRGRVLRKYSGKSKAVVYDFVVLPPKGDFAVADKAEKAIIRGEFQRVRDFIETASNKADIYEHFLDKMREFGVYL